MNSYNYRKYVTAPQEDHIYRIRHHKTHITPVEVSSVSRVSHFLAWLCHGYNRKWKTKNFQHTRASLKTTRRNTFTIGNMLMPLRTVECLPCRLLPIYLFRKGICILVLILTSWINNFVYPHCTHNGPGHTPLLNQIP